MRIRTDNSELDVCPYCLKLDVVTKLVTVSRPKRRVFCPAHGDVTVRYEDV